MDDSIESAGRAHEGDAWYQLLLPLRVAAKLLGISSVTLRRRVRAGEIGHVRDHGRLFFRLSDIDAYIARRHRPEIGRIQFDVR